MAIEYRQTILPSNAPETTPTATKTARDYALALLGVGKNDMNQPISHWSQGVANMVKALVGGNELYNEQNKERGQLARDATNRAIAIPGATSSDAPVGIPNGFASAEEEAAPAPQAKMAFGSTNDPSSDPDQAQPFSDGDVPVPRPRPDATSCCRFLSD